MKRQIAALVVFGLALVPRVSLPGWFLTVDEAYHWFDRATRFLQAVQQGDFALTNQIGHPGVTTMWLGAAGLLLEQGLMAAGVISGDSPAVRYALMRLPVAVVNAACVAVAFRLLVPLVGGQVALLAGVLLAFDPFLVAHSRLLHVDGLLASFVTVSLLAVLVAVLPTPDQRVPRRMPLLFAGVVAGLALLTKSPALMLIPTTGVVVLVGCAVASGGMRPGWQRWFPAVLRCTVGYGVLWLVAVVVTWVLLYPAAWVDLRGVVGRVFVQVAYEGATPHGWGNFFMGRAVADPGGWFYPVALLMRLPPWTGAGLVAAGYLLVRWRDLSDGQRWLLATLLAYSVLFVLVLTVAPKKFDRYLLPVVPALTIMAAVGLAGVAQRVQAAVQWQWLPVLVRVAFVGLVVGTLLLYYPYHLAYYSPLLGGSYTAPRVLPVGWGEGLEQAAAYIRAQPDGCDYPVATWYRPVLAAFSCTPVLGLPAVSEPGRVDYAILYLDQVQRGNAPAATARLQAQPPVHTVIIHGIPYAAIYQLPRPLQTRSGAQFGDSITLHSYSLTPPTAPDAPLLLETQWHALRPPPPDHLLFVHVVDADGTRVAQVDVPPAGPRAPTSVWRQHHYYTWQHPIPLPPDLPLGEYQVVVGLYDAASGARLPVSPATDVPGMDGNSLPLQSVVLP